MAVFWIRMSATKMYNLVKFQNILLQNSVAKSRVGKFLRKCSWYNIYSMNVSHYFAHLLIVNHQILLICYNLNLETINSDFKK